MIRLTHILLLLLSAPVLSQQDGTIELVAGGGSEVGNNVPAKDLLLKRALGVDVDIVGNIYIADTDNHVIRHIDRLSGVATIIAGIVGEAGFSGDGGPASNARLNRPGAVSVNDDGVVFIGDTENRRLRQIDPSTGTITTIAGTGERGRFPDFATSVANNEVQFGEIVSLFAASNTVWVGDGLDADGSGNNQILQVRLDNDSTSVIAGNGRFDFSGDGGRPVDAGLTVEGLAGDLSDGFRLVFADILNHRIRAVGQVDNLTTITTLAGRGPADIFGGGGYGGDGGPAGQSLLNYPAGATVSGDGTIYIADTGNGRVRAVDLDGSIVTVAGSGTFGLEGDGDLGVLASLRIPVRVAIDFDGNLLVLDSDQNHSVLRRLINPRFRFPLLESNRETINFTPASLGVGSTLDLVISNAGNAELILSTFEFDNPLFSLNETLPISIGPNLQRAIQIRFDPLGVDLVDGILTIRTNDLQRPVLTLTLSGSGIVPDIDILPARLDFDPTFTDQTRQQRLRISNLTQGQLQIEQIVLSDTTNFAVTELDQQTVFAGTSQDINVIFQPTVSGPISAELTIFSNDPDEAESTVPITGSGIIPKPGGFVDLASTMGVADPGASFGVAWADYDDDGDPDVYVTKSLEPNRLYRNDGQTFTDVSLELGVADPGDGSGAAWADFDGDGDLDLYVTNFGQPNKLFRNDGESFSEVGAIAGVDDTGDGFGSAWADTDRDGDPDLYVANFGPNVFFENLGNGTFQETGSILGIADSSSGIQPVFADFDNDSDPDLFVANSGPNRLWWNNGDGTFKDATKAFVPRDAGASTGAAVGDFDNDGFLDLYVPYFGTNRLYQNQGGTGFADVGRALGVADEGNGRGAVWGDFDNDGSIDLFITNRDSENKIFRNIGGDAQFQEVGKAFGVNANADSRGIAMADFDGDGGLDVFVAIQNRPDQLFWNQEAEGNWLTVVPRGTVSSTDAIGTRIEIVYGRNNKSVREIAGGTSFLSQDALSASFGVGETATIDTLSIRWPSGIFQRFSRADIGINRVLNILEIEPLPPVDVQVVTTSDVLIANGTAETEIAVRLLNQEREISLVSGRSITYSLDVGGGTLIPAGPTITDGFSSARFRAGSFAGTMPLTIIVAGLPTQRLLLKLLPPLLPSDTFIERIAGSGRRGFGGDGGPATQADLNTPRAVAVDSAENVYIADSANNRIRVVSPTDSSIVTVAGSGAAGSGTIFDGNALDADIADPRGLAITGDGALLISESGGQRVRSVNLTTGITRAFAGSGFAGFSGDGGPATDANLTTPRGITVDNLGRVSIADLFNNAIRRVEDGVITTVAGDPLDFFPLGDGIPATESRVQGPNGVAVDNDGNTYIAEVFGHRIRKVDSSGIITTYAGDGTAGSAGDGGPAQFARLNAPQDLVYDPAGRLYVSDSGNHIIRSIDLATGVIQKIAGSGFSGSTGNQGPSLDFSLDQPGGIALAMDGSLIISDALNDRVLRLTVQFQDDRPAADPTPIDPSGSDGTADFNGDGNVDFQDFLPFAEAFGSNNQAFDLDGDGQVGFSDFLTFANAFGRTVASNPALLGRTVWLKR